MAITFPLSLPTVPGFRSFTVYRPVAIGSTSSPFSYQGQVQAHEGDAWMIDVQFPPMERADAQPWIGLLTALEGPLGTFLLGDPLAATPLGTGAGTPKVQGGSQTGKSLLTDGWAASETVLKAGDYFALGNRLYMSKQDVVSSGGGVATIYIFPSLRESPADNADLDLTAPKGLFRLAEGQDRLYTVNDKGHYVIGFQAVEAL